MKTLSFIFLLFIVVSCATKPVVSQSQLEEYEIVRLAAEQYDKVVPFRIMEKPDMSVITDYFNGFYQHGFYDGPLQLPGVTFSFKNNPVSKWDKKIMDKIIPTKKVIIIKDSEKIPPVTKHENALTFFSFSNPIFSNDGQYALINTNQFSNLVAFGSMGDIMIFKKIDGKWLYQEKFTAYLE